MAPRESQLRLEAEAGRVAATARAVRDWVRSAQQSAPPVAAEADSLIAESRRLEGIARKLAAASTRRMCVGIFGASQQGKSYLVSILAQVPGSGRLLAKLGNEVRDFIVDINPQGGRESTALVTRFTVEPSEREADPAFPVDFSLLDELDLVKILGNTFQSDFDQNKVEIPVPRGDDIRAIIAAAETKAQSRPVVSHLDEINVCDVSEYFYRNFRNRWVELNAVNYWERIIDLAPRLPVDARAGLFAPIWGGLDDLTRLFLRLVQVLERLGHPAEAVAEMGALLPRSNSIIDIETLKRLGTRDEARDPLRVRIRSGRGLGAPVEVPRAMLAGLIGELRITMSETPWPMFAHTDLLDFPGARSRMQMQSLPVEPEKRRDEVNLMLLRGKVAYLFQRYADERELTAMLLCMGNKPTNVNDLGVLVRQWIELTHGATPEARRQVPTSLFLVLTMMDLEFVPKAGDGADAIAAKWDVRLQTSLLEQYQRDEWPLNFDGRPFSNTLMLRNYNIEQPQLVEYALDPGTHASAKPTREVGLSKTYQGFIDALERSFMASSQVNAHFSAPRRAWDEMMSLNDGGISYIVERLSAVSDLALKDQQVAQRLGDAVRPLRETLRRFYHGVAEADRSDKEAALAKLRLALLRGMARRNFRRFGRFVAGLMLPTQEIRHIACDAAAFRPELPTSDGLDIDDGELETLLEAALSTGESKAVPAFKTVDRPEHFAKELCSRWISHLRLLAQDDTLLQHYDVENKVVSDIVDQMIIAADRQKLASTIAARVRQATTSPAARWEDMADRIAVIANDILNGFVSTLGYRDVPLAKRPVNGPEGQQRRVFQAAPALGPNERPKLGARLEALETRYVADWAAALVRVGVENMDFGGGRALSPELNAALGEMLSRLTVQPAAT